MPSKRANLENYSRAVNVNNWLPLDSKALGTLAVKSGSTWTGRATEGSSNFGTLSGLADFGRCGTSVVCGVHINSKLSKEAAHSDVAIKNTASLV